MRYIEICNTAQAILQSQQKKETIRTNYYKCSTPNLLLLKQPTHLRRAELFIGVPKFRGQFLLGLELLLKSVGDIPNLLVVHLQLILKRWICSKRSDSFESKGGILDYKV